MADINTQQIQDALDGLSRTTNALGAAEAAVAAESARNSEALKKAAMSLQSFGGALLSSDRSLGKYSNSVSQAADAAASVANNFGLIGAAAGVLIKIFGGLAAAGLKQHDGLISTYRTLSNFGALNFDSSIDGIEQLKDQLKDIGATYENSAYFAKLIGDIAPDLVSLSGDVGKGKEQIVSMTRTLLDTEEVRLKNLGFTTESIAETAGRFTATQARLSINQGNDQVKLSSIAAKYMTNLAELSALTGVSRDKQQQLVDAQMRDVQWRAYLSGLKDDERQAAMDTVRAYSAVNESFGESIKERLAMEGGYRTQLSANVSNMVPEIYAMAKNAIATQVNKTGSAEIEVLKGLKNNLPVMQEYTRSLRSSVINMDTASNAQLGFNAAIYDTESLLKGMKTPEEMQKFVDDLRITAAANKGRMAEQTKFERDQRVRDNALADLQFSTGNKAISVIGKFSEVINDAAAGVARFTKTVTGGRVDWTESFRQFNSIKDTQDALKDYGDKEKKLKEEQIKIQTDLNNALTKKQDLDKKNATQTEKDAAIKEISNLQSNLSEINSQLSATGASSKNARAAQQRFAVQGGANVNGTIVGSGAGIDERLGGLRKVRLTGDTHREGSQIDPRLISAAEKLEQGLPELSMFTSFNDEHHKTNRPNSKHVIGQAIDFTLQQKPTPKDFEEKIVPILKAAGFKSFRDEYNKPNADTRGPHIHAELATGGIVRGPKTGYPAMLHGTEAIIPMNMFKDFGNLVTKFPLLGGTGTTNSNNDMGALITVMDTISTKIDEMVNYQRRSVNTQEEILTFTKH